MLPSELETVVPTQISPFIDLYDQLTALYGTPTCRYFYAKDRRAYTGNGGYRFESGHWSRDDLQSLLESEGAIITVIAWVNVCLEWAIDTVYFHKLKMDPQTDIISDTYRLGITIYFKESLNEGITDLMRSVRKRGDFLPLQGAKQKE